MSTLVALLWNTNTNTISSPHTARLIQQCVHLFVVVWLNHLQFQRLDGAHRWIMWLKITHHSNSHTLICLLKCPETVLLG